jgi:hypothetical protein
MSLETSDDSGVHRLDMRRKIGAEIFDTDVGEIGWCFMACKIVL